MHKHKKGRKSLVHLKGNTLLPQPNCLHHCVVFFFCDYHSVSSLTCLFGDPLPPVLCDSNVLLGDSSVFYQPMKAHVLFLNRSVLHLCPLYCDRFVWLYLPNMSCLFRNSCSWKNHCWLRPLQWCINFLVHMFSSSSMGEWATTFLVSDS